MDAVRERIVPVIWPMAYVFQPIIDVHEGAVAGYEALMRPEGHSPEAFIKKHYEKLHDLEIMTFFQAIREFMMRRLPGRLFVNSFPCESLSDIEFDLLEDTFGSAMMKRLVIELLEYPKYDLAAWEKKRSFIKKNKIMLAIDDFGSGGNDVNTLFLFNPDIVKLDRKLIRGIDQDPVRQYLMKIVVDLIRDQGIQVLAEGVESKGEVELMARMHVDYMQGFFVGMPF